MKTLKNEKFGKQILGAATVTLLKSEKRGLFVVQARQGTGGQGTFEIKEENEALDQFYKCCEYALGRYGKFISIDQMLNNK